MAYELLLSARKKTVGAKQTLKAIERGQAKVVYIAQNADKHVVEPIFRICASKGIRVIQAESMQALGKACGIEVRCASAAVIEE
ncbi:ribosomal L7Ae/L30e/S12e/Gadd45 family protein [Pelotomaculum isophthalicicum JI]|uniref:Ribosomal L7Ae/L30e/S12e/Gadd45 family protein n=1 Tax=Pelotomaculum isophthalicicum JI TaxID=947010 RepID=A0A9X4H786_9FIRM|nr:ribosomal L7Ae/L30e/S12e/Gadd45 family protein [Pelotomaculum isophthalicicum]MDF9407534.1 ribosomal L7Ae/L30e/S12e/Gadd45 family protein [Pelotomaculum isophthalicicum JI]